MGRWLFGVLEGLQVRLRTVLLPDAVKDQQTGEYRLEDYVSVPAINLYGTWTVQESMPAEHAAALARWTSEYERRKRLGIRRVREVTAPPELLRSNGKG